MWDYHPTNISWDKRKAHRDICNCRTPNLGGFILKCDDCGKEEHRYRSCGNRNCPICQGMKQHIWVENRKAEALTVPYFHVVFTVPDVLNRIPQLKAEKDGAVEVFGRGNAEVYINGRKVQDLKELSRIQSDQIRMVDVVQNPGARYAASVKAVVRIMLMKQQGEGWSFIEKASAGYHYASTASNNLDVNYRHGGLDVTGSLWAGYDYENKFFQENILSYQVAGKHYRGEAIRMLR